jgi:hypothetical protein
MNGSPGRPGRDEDPAVPRDRATLDGRLRQAFANARPPGAPDTLWASLERLPATAGRPHVARRWAMARGLASVGILAVMALAGALVVGRLPGPVATAPPTTSELPTASTPVQTPPPTGLPSLPAGAIPWVDATPPPATRPTPRPVPPGTRACVAADLDATAFWDGATGSMGGGIGVTNVSPTACVLDGPPKLVVIRSGSNVLSTDYTAVPTGGLSGRLAAGPGLLEPGDMGGWALTWNNWCGRDLTPTSVTVKLAHGGGTLVARADPSFPGFAIRGTPRCDAPDFPSSLSVMAFEVQQPEPEPPDSQPASATINAPPTAIIGRDLTFTVALANLGDQPAILDPCPIYSEDLVIGGARLKPPADRRYVLNCAAIGDALAPGATIVLEMRYPVPDTIAPGPAELLWTVDDPPLDDMTPARVPIDLVAPDQASGQG